MRRIGVAVIGCGHIAQTVHIPNIIKNPETKLVSTVDSDKKKLFEIQEKFGIKNSTTNYEDTLADHEVDSVLICTPTHTHKELTITAAEAGKHVFCEKPMAVSSEEAGEMVKAVERNSVKLMVGHFMRFLPNHVKAKDLIREGKLGKVFYAEAYSEIPGPYEYPRSHFFFKRNKGGGALLDYGIHLIDILCWLFDNQKISRVAGLTHSFTEDLEVENASTLILQFSNGVLGKAGAFWVPWKSWEVVDRYVKVLGTQGKIVSELTGPSLTLYREGTLLSRLLGEQRIIPRSLHPKLPGSEYAYRKELEEFIRSILQDEEPPVNGRYGKRLLEIIEAARRFHETGEFAMVG